MMAYSNLMQKRFGINENESGIHDQAGFDEVPIKSANDGIAELMAWSGFQNGAYYDNGVNETLTSVGSSSMSPPVMPNASLTGQIHQATGGFNMGGNINYHGGMVGSVAPHEDVPVEPKMVGFPSAKLETDVQNLGVASAPPTAPVMQPLSASGLDYTGAGSGVYGNYVGINQTGNNEYDTQSQAHSIEGVPSRMLSVVSSGDTVLSDFAPELSLDFGQYSMLDHGSMDMSPEYQFRPAPPMPASSHMQSPAMGTGIVNINNQQGKINNQALNDYLDSSGRNFSNMSLKSEGLGQPYYPNNNAAGFEKISFDMQIQKPFYYPQILPQHPASVQAASMPPSGVVSPAQQQNPPPSTTESPVIGATRQQHANPAVNHFQQGTVQSSGGYQRYLQLNTDTKKRYRVIRGVSAGGCSTRPPKHLMGSNCLVLPVKLELNGAGVEDLCYPEWQPSEKEDRRRIIRIERIQEGPKLIANFSVVGSANENPMTLPPPPDVDVIEVSCLECSVQLNDDDLSPSSDSEVVPEERRRLEYYITSVEVVEIVELLIGTQSRDPVERRRERGRIRSNLVPFWSKKPISSRMQDRNPSISSGDSFSTYKDFRVELAKRIMGYEIRKPRGFDKEVRILKWSKLVPALKRALQSYYTEIPAPGSMMPMDC